MNIDHFGNTTNIKCNSIQFIYMTPIHNKTPLFTKTIIIIQSHPYILIDLSYQKVKCTQLVILISKKKKKMSKEAQQIPSGYWFAADIRNRLQAGWGTVPSGTELWEASVIGQTLVGGFYAEVRSDDNIDI